MEQKGRPYTIEKYNPKWKIIYKQEKKILLSIFGKCALNINHIGSTSVPGMWAKPQIDIQVIVDDLSLIDNLVAPMIVNGYNYQSNKILWETVVGEKYFTKDAPTGERLVSVHIRSKNNPNSVSAIYFRDYLRSHPSARDLYSKTKLQSYNEGKTDRADYPAGKKDVLHSLIEKAKMWYEAKN